MNCALAAVGFIDGNLAYNQAVIIDAIKSCVGKADIVIFGEAFLQGFHAMDLSVEHDTAVAVSRSDPAIQKICRAAEEYAVAVSFGFLEKDGDAFFSSQMTVDRNGRPIDLSGGPSTPITAPRNGTPPQSTNTPRRPPRSTRPFFMSTPYASARPSIARLPKAVPLCSTKAPSKTNCRPATPASSSS